MVLCFAAWFPVSQWTLHLFAMSSASPPSAAQFECLPFPEPDRSPPAHTYAHILEREINPTLGAMRSFRISKVHLFQGHKHKFTLAAKLHREVKNFQITNKMPNDIAGLHLISLAALKCQSQSQNENTTANSKTQLQNKKHDHKKEKHNKTGHHDISSPDVASK